MKNLIYYNITIITILLNSTHIFSMQHYPHYKIKYEFITPWFSLNQIKIANLLKNDKIIAQFHIPMEITKTPHSFIIFNKNNTYLLILAAPWSLFYQQDPTFEWQLYDLKNQKVIKSFPRQSSPQFTEDNNIIIFQPNNQTFVIQ